MSKQKAFINHLFKYNNIYLCTKYNKPCFHMPSEFIGSRGDDRPKSAAGVKCVEDGRTS